ncbi:uncharacterized protein [Spinacia oleracea]|uniref:Reverse transcriptase domain-containing protein n=1 Tax=Spinacia oleracea TaxID=3562 RepID=A0ABM3QPV3_SPIOL|nr:uncharacterized protein LOC130461345 [Spinacia oleracea]
MTDHKDERVTYTHPLFKLEPVWYAEPGFIDMVNENLNTDCSSLVPKLSNISKKMSSWAKQNIGNFQKNGRTLSARLKGIQKALETRPTSRHLLELNEELSKELSLIYEQQEAFWMARARSNWIKSGDANTGFFHKSVIIRRRRNKISKLNSDVGMSVEGPDLVPHIVSYFTKLFTSESTISPCEDHHYTNEISIDHPTSIEEVRRAVFQLGALKAPGKDGLHAFFYQQHWGNLWQDTYNFVDSILQNRFFPNSVNDTTISIIPKSEHPETIKQFRPISLCNVNYKIVSKVLVNRIRPHLGDLISPNQNSFLPGRGCEINYIDASEILHSMKTRKGKFGWFVFKIDLEKAYDRLEWNFIRFCLARKGFSKNSCDLIMNCIASPSTSIIVNGQPSPSFKTSRGIRQGDPLSPYIFILCMEYLADLITESATKGDWKPFCVRRNGIPITHLMFADDLILFGDTSNKTLQSIRNVLGNFWEVSGQKMNNAKSKMYFSKHTPQEQKDLFCSALEVQPSPDLGTYLGFPLTDKRPTKNQTEYVCRNIKSKLASWKAKCLSKAGRLVLIKASLTAIANYSMQVLYLPKKTLKTIDQICAKFLWDYEPQTQKTHLVAWLKSCGDMKLGELSIRSAIIMNQVLMAKLCWKFDTTTNLASKLVKDKYIENRPYPTPFHKGSHIWQNVGNGWDLYQKFSAWYIGDGDNINLWHDNWTGKGPLRSLVAGPMNTGEEHKKLSSIISNGKWNIKYLSFILPADLVLWIQAIPLPQFGRDGPYCSLTLGLKFDSKTAYNTIWRNLFPELLPNDKWSYIWKARCPPRIQFFLWLILWKRLPTAFHLASRHIIPNPHYIFCPTAQEDMAHIFLHCPRAQEFLSEVAFKPMINHVNVDFEYWFLENLKNNSTDPNPNTPLPQTLFAFCLWRIWIRRNMWAFQKENKNITPWCQQTMWLSNEFEQSQNTQGPKPHVIAGVAGTFTTNSAKTAEAQEILLAVSWSVNNNWENTTIYSDCKAAVEELNDDQAPTTNLTNLYGKCRALQKSHGSLCVKFQRREQLLEVDYVAKKAKARLSLLDQGVKISPPPILANDISSNNETYFLGACLLHNYAISGCIFASERSGAS